ncbi:hypothetical protein MT997_25220 [Paenibacillus sp. OVF10]|nr:hypothetical protein MT997_25220 [Paenibacillus sp. OVF10]
MLKRTTLPIGIQSLHVGSPRFSKMRIIINHSVWSDYKRAMVNNPVMTLSAKKSVQRNVERPFTFL